MVSQNTERSVLKEPYLWIAWVIGIAFPLMGGVLLWMYAAQALDLLQNASLDDLSESQRDAMIAWAVSIGFIAIGLPLLIAMIVLWAGQTPFRHAPAGTLPGVPTLPLDTYTNSFVKPAGGRRIQHRWIEHGENLELQPDPSALRQLLVGFAITVILLLAGFAALVFGTPMFAEVEIMGWSIRRSTFFAVAAGLMIIAAGIVFAVLLFLWRREQYSVSFDSHNDTWRVDRDDEPTRGRISDLVAIQLCIHHQIVGSRTRRSSYYTYQLILVESNDGGGYGRHLILEAQGPANRIAQVGSAVAEQFNLPLLHHATSVHRTDAKLEGRKRFDASHA